MRVRGLTGTAWMLLALCAAPLAAQAQEAAEAKYALAAPTLDEAEQAPLPPLSAEELAALADALTFDPVTLGSAKSAKPLRLRGLTDRGMLDLSGTAKPNGAGTVVLKPALPMEWDAKVGADLGLPAEAFYSDQAVLPVRRNGSGAAWASVGVPNLASLDARVDPGSDQGKLGTTFKQSIPVGSGMSVTLHNSYAVTETFGPPAPPSSDLPLMALPQDATGQAPSQVWSAENAVKFNIASTGTTLGAGLNSTSTDPVTHNTLSAEQKLLGPLNVMAAVTDIGQTGVNKRITAGFKLNW